MSSHNSKREANFPLEKMSTKKANLASNLPPKLKQDCNISIDVLKLNGEDFFGNVSDNEVLYIFVQVFKRTKDELVGVKTSRNLQRNVRITFKFNKPITSKQFHNSPSFSFDRYLDPTSVENVSGIIVGHSKPRPLQLGQLGKIQFTTQFKVEAKHVPHLSSPSRM